MKNYLGLFTGLYWFLNTVWSLLISPAALKLYPSTLKNQELCQVNTSLSIYASFGAAADDYFLLYTDIFLNKLTNPGNIEEVYHSFQAAVNKCQLKLIESHVTQGKQGKDCHTWDIHSI